MPKRLHTVKQELFENIFKNAHGGIAIVGLDGSWVKVNESIINLFGYKKDELYSMSFQDITHKDDLDKDIQYVHDLLDGKIESFQDEKRYFHKDGHVIWTLISVSLMRDANNKPLYFISQIIDISEQKESTKQLELLMNIAKQQNEKLMSFAHIATHDIRTHVGNLNTITNFIEQEHESINEDENFELLKDALSHLNETLLHLNKVRKQELSENDGLKALNLNEFITNAIYNVTAIANVYKFKIINNVSPEIEVMAIEAYLDSIILNFLTNAIKYREEERQSYLKIDASVNKDDVLITFKDNGMGFDLEKNRNKLFKLNATFHKKKDSRGVGLFITKNHIESMGGKINVKSKINVGTCFYVHLKKNLN
ncbi:PAS domain S-box protein [uncultured Psychroserpens sp.]|uniref:sensor histidine kinase n=1 Tax=uncultured Psychroserpens sp. TaxID=255436 RepID=UPI00261EA432|nr:sensor histidine kinase [uncultured Psychroserpens sp.]